MLAHLVSVLAQSGNEGQLNWGSLISGALGSSPVAIVLAWQLWQTQKKLAERESELRETNEKTLALAERALPALTEATRTLAEVRVAMDADTRRRVDPTGELERILHRVERHLTTFEDRGT